MPNSLDFYKAIFLHLIPVCIIVPCFIIFSVSDTTVPLAKKPVKELKSLVLEQEKDTSKCIENVIYNHDHNIMRPLMIEQIFLSP